VKLGESAFSKGVRDGIFIKDVEVSFGRTFLFGGVRAAVEFWVEQKRLSAAKVRVRMLRMAMASLKGPCGVRK
ncbi:MAG TPA: hypothetical protein VLM37_03095, partial [Fibrobacteraceae bacterium]|nr:hypothetical protein [Fibrobacteraceae bacterium]